MALAAAHREHASSQRALTLFLHVPSRPSTPRRIPHDHPGRRPHARSHPAAHPRRRRDRRHPTLFDGKKVVLFAVPGAFTPTCSEKHLPGLRASTSTSSARSGIEVACMSVNDPFVMQAWGQSQHVPDGLQMLADGNGDFTRALGLELDASAYGMGTRSQALRAVCRRRRGQAAASSRRRANSGCRRPSTCSTQLASDGRTRGTPRHTSRISAARGISPATTHRCRPAPSACARRARRSRGRSCPRRATRRSSGRPAASAFAPRCRSRATTVARACTLPGARASVALSIDAFDAQFFGRIAAVGAQSGDSAGSRAACAPRLDSHGDASAGQRAISRVAALVRASAVGGRAASRCGHRPRNARGRRSTGAHRVRRTSAAPRHRASMPSVSCGTTAAPADPAAGPAASTPRSVRRCRRWSAAAPSPRCAGRLSITSNNSGNAVTAPYWPGNGVPSGRPTQTPTL